MSDEGLGPRQGESALCCEEERRVLRRSMRRESRRLRRLIAALEIDLGRAAEAPLMRRQGEVLKVNLKRVPRGADRVQLSLPWEPDELIEVPLRRDLTPAANLDRLFRRARGLEKARPAIERRREEAAQRQGALASLRAELVALEQPDVSEPAPSASAVRELLDRGRALGLRIRAGPPASPDQAPHDVRKRMKGKGKLLPSGVQRFTTASGREVFVGRSAAANDALVTRLLRGRDVWMHVRDRTGAHLLLRAAKRGEAPAQGDLRSCAMLVAHLSGIGKGDRVEVSWAQGRDVRKVKGSAAGLVYVSGDRTVYVEVEAEVIDAFYARRGSSR